MEIGCNSGRIMSFKQMLLDLIEHPVLGAPLRAIGRLSTHAPHIGGLINPFFVPAIVVEREGAALIAERGSYLFESAWPRQAVRFQAEEFEPEISFLIPRLISDDDVVLDIGANVGLHTVAFARAASRGRVIAFEPVAEMAERLSENCALNGIGNVTLVPCALGAANDVAEMQVNVAGAGMEGTSSLAGTVHMEANPGHYQNRQVPVRRLDDVIASLGIEGRIGFVKIDTEGFESYVIEGGFETLNRHKPVMIIEAHSRRLEKAGKSFQWYLDTFPDHHIFIVYATGRANPYLRLTPLKADQPEIAVNLLLVPKTRSFDLAKIG